MPPSSLKISRIAVSSFFFVNGFLFANWTARLPELQAYYGLSNSQLGTVLFCISLGSMAFMPTAGWLAARFGSDKVVRITGLLFCLAIPLVPMFRNEWLIRLCFFFLGASAGCTDVTMNGQAVLVERLWGKTIISSFHAVFSIGMALGAGCGSLFSKYAISLQNHLMWVAIFGVVLTLLSSTRLLHDTPENVSEVVEIQETPNRWNALQTVLPFGILAFCCMTGEGSMIDWSAIFMHKVIGQNEVISAWAFGAFGVAMTLGRIFGDYFTIKLGKYKLMLIDSFLAIIGLFITLAFVTVWSTFLGLFLVGLGLSTIVPIVFSSAGNIRGISPTVGISMATSIGYSGFFIGPPTIGFLGDAFGLRIGLGFVLALFVLMALIIFKILNKALT